VGGGLKDGGRNFPSAKIGEIFPLQKWVMFGGRGVEGWWEKLSLRKSRRNFPSAKVGYVWWEGG